MSITITIDIPQSPGLYIYYHVSLLCAHFRLPYYLFVSEVWLLHRVLSEPPPVQRLFQLMAPEVQQISSSSSSFALNCLFHHVLKLLLLLRLT